MAHNLTPDLKRKGIAIFALVATLLWQTTFSQVLVIVFSALFGYLLFKQKQIPDSGKMNFPISRLFAIICLGLFFALLIFLPIINEILSSNWLAMFDSFYRSGALVFGGGHVVLPLLQNEFVPTGQITEKSLFIRLRCDSSSSGSVIYIRCLFRNCYVWLARWYSSNDRDFPTCIFALIGTLPFWDILRSHPKMRGSLMGSMQQLLEY